MPSLSSYSSRKGFTLIELMVAISIVAILATIGMVMFSSAQATARDAKRKGDLEDIRKAMYSYQASSGTMCLWANAASCSNPTSVNWATWVNESATGYGFQTPPGHPNYNNSLGKVMPYLKSVPQDPKYGSAGQINYGLAIQGSDKFYVYAQLEGVTTPNFGICPNPSPWFAGANYCVSY